jgi:hypothetical protein
MTSPIEPTKNTQHTPGPWVRRAGSLYGADGKQVVFGRANFALRLASATEEEIANTTLAEAAPELLEALKDALAGWRYIREHHGDLYGVGWDRVENAARAAILRAESH